MATQCTDVRSPLSSLMVMQIPIELLTAGRDLTEPRPSPDGVDIAFVQKWRGTSAIMIVGIGGGPERILTTGPDPAPGRGMGGGCFTWLPDGSGVVYVATDGEIWRQSFGAAAVQITDFGRQCQAPSVSPDGRRLVVAVDEAEVWLVDIARSGTDDTAARTASDATRLDDGGDAFCFDPIIGTGAGVEAVRWQGWSPPDMPWDGAAAIEFDLGSGRIDRWRPDHAAVQQTRWTPNGERVCVHDASGWLNVHIDDDPVLPEAFEQAGPTWGMGQRSFAVSPDGGHVAFCRNESGFGRLVVVDRRTGTVTNIGKGGHGQLHWVGDRITALRSGAVTPTQVVAYDVSSLGDPIGGPSEQVTKPPRTILAVGPAAGWDRHDLPEPQLVEVPHDGVVLHARRYVANDADGEGVADGDGRMLVWVHGGPTDQWQADFRPRISYWWSRGWDVLVVDPRGTTGHGRKYQRALNGQWGRLDVDDTAALIAHAHHERWATPATTVVIGGSSGGLTVLGVLADHGALVAGGVASYPVSDLRALTAATHRFEAHYTDTLVGASSFDDLSPINRADRITVPLLVFHGTDDPVVPIGQSEELARRGGDVVELVVYPGEGHGFRDPVNVRDEYDRTESFLRDSVRTWHS